MAATQPLRLMLAILVLAAGFAGFLAPAQAATPAEQYITDNVQKGLTILNNKQLSKDQRRTQFQVFLLGLTDIKTIADYTLGQYRRSASPDDLAAFDDAFKDYALAVYQTYFNKFSGQTLQVTGSYPLAADESVVKTVMIDPAKSHEAKPLEVDFRVVGRNGRLAVIDFSVEGVWLREMQRSEFTSYLGQNNGDVPTLISSLKKKAQQIR
ncbi:MAG: ABC transporter substrate-binding protein [Alphaproteobacteria bacterium]|nr:ABC transporter substrate-binding protein [Alphaproteobacteria bacterium]MDE2629502.1 ABC transporter substrate-binding protein [Alphaproteobacteria bacterium]